jgi:phosphomannomutase/phosphoglucomutase
MENTIFREYDIRGKVGTELIIDEVYHLTCAIAYYFKERAPQIKTIAVGMDGRIHSPAIKAEMCRALVDSGLSVIFVGLCATPAFYFALHTLPVDGGLMITASHNGKEYNGIKICLGTYSVWGNELQTIRDLYHAHKKITSHEKGSLTEHPITEQYVAWLVNHFKDLKNMDLAAVVDCGNGTAGTVMPQLIKEMNWSRVKLLYPEVDGTYPHHPADPTEEKNMREVKQLLANTDAEIGIGLDGDCDRMAAMTKEGFLVPGDQLLAVFAKPVIKKGVKERAVSIVYDIKSSTGLSELVSKWGGKPVMSPSGHSIIKEYVKQHQALLGGELSCHFFFNDRYFGYDDGIYALCRLFEILHTSGKTVEQLIAVFPHKYSSREFRIFCPDDRKQLIVNAVRHALEQRAGVSLITIDGVRASMAYGWGIVRPSNTQPALSIRFEGYTKQGLQQVKNDFIAVLQSYIPESNLTSLFNE